MLLDGSHVARVIQSNAIRRYVAKMAGLYPDEDRHALYCDEVTGTLDHIPSDIVQELAPGLFEHQQRMALEPGVVAYYSSRAGTGQEE